MENRINEESKIEDKINELNELLNISSESSNILQRIVHLEKELYDKLILAEYNLKSNIVYVNYINHIYDKR